MRESISGQLFPSQSPSNVEGVSMLSSHLWLYTHDAFECIWLDRCGNRPAQYDYRKLRYWKKGFYTPAFILKIFAHNSRCFVAIGYRSHIFWNVMYGDKLRRNCHKRCHLERFFFKIVTIQNICTAANASYNRVELYRIPSNHAELLQEACCVYCLTHDWSNI